MHMVTGTSAAQQGLAACPHCQLVVRMVGNNVSAAFAICPRCAAVVHFRKPHSLQRTWALLVCAAICYIPANLLPILTVIQFGSGEPDTILSGVQHLFAEGQWPIAILVFVASVFVPLAKIGVLGVLMISVHAHWHWRPRQRALLYHLVDALGRWSMIDIFMISILVALVQIGALATVEAGLGAAFFAAMVFCTMLAAMSFDPRLLWDNAR
ncbi:MAG: paraquat-inducible protein A [Gammaproteobacteria bacterium]|jgi:paraquat-inducible protein A